MASFPSGWLKPAIASEPPQPRLQDAGLEVGPADVVVALMTFAGSLAVLLYGLSAVASFPIFLALHVAVLVVPAAFVAIRAQADDELTVPVLLLLATFASGPVGALGCAALALVLWCQRPAAARLQVWYDSIAGVVARSRLTRIYDELASGRVLAHALARRLGTAFHVEQVVGNLKRHAEAAAVAV